jgi:hypothetical protein
MVVKTRINAANISEQRLIMFVFSIVPPKAVHDAYRHNNRMLRQYRAKA